MQRVCCNIVEVGAIFSIQLSSQSQFSKTKIEEVIAENKCEQHKNRVYKYITYFRKSI